MKTITTSKVEIILPEKEFLKMLGVSNCKIRNVCFKEKDKDKGETRVIQVSFEDNVQTEESK